MNQSLGEEAAASMGAGASGSRGFLVRVWREPGERGAEDVRFLARELSTGAERWFSNFESLQAFLVES